MGTEVLAAAAYSAMIEQVLPEVPKLYESTDRLSKLIGHGKFIKISDRFARAPMLKYVGGTWQMFNADNGAVGSGSGLNTINFNVGYYYTNYGVVVSRRAKDTTDSAEQSRVQVFTLQQAEAMQEMAVYEDITLHTDGTGLLTNASSAISGGNTLTFAGSWDTLGVNLVRPGMAVNVVAVGTGTIGSVPTGTTADTGGAIRANATNPGLPAIITDIDYDARKVYLDATITSLTQGDRLQIVGLQLVPSQTGKSGYPNRDFTNVNMDSFRHGIPYMNQVDQTLYYGGINRATTPQINPVVYNVQGNAWTANHTLIVRDRMTERRDPSVLQGLMGFCHMAQRAQAMNIGISVSEWQRNSASNEPLLDLMPKNIGYEESFVVGGIVHYLTKRQPRDRIDYFNPKLMGRAGLFDGPRPMEWGGNYIWPTFSTAGQMQAGYQMFWEQNFDFFSNDPGIGMVLFNCGIPQGYTPGT